MCTFPTPTEWNVFQHLLDNWLFVAIIIITCVFQAIMVEFGGEAVKTSGLTAFQWALCIFLGALELPIGILSPPHTHAANCVSKGWWLDLSR